MDQTAATTKQEKLDFWVKQLTEHQMPVFAQTARVIAREAASRESTAGDLAELILQDASMTARLLRVANSIYYNPHGHPINTVSRAIVVLGFEAMRNICYSINMVDSVNAGDHKDEAIQEMARGFHAAVQARTIARHRGDKSPEEVFIATLLYRLGSMAFWCFADKIDPQAAPQLKRALARGGDIEEQERDILGFTLAELTAALNQHWNLSDLLGSSLRQKSGDNPRSSNVTLAHELARCTERGWDTPETRQLLERVAEVLYMPGDKVTELIRENAREASLSMVKLGARDAGRLIPMPSEYRNAPVETEADIETHGEFQQFMQPDTDLQMKVLRELSELLAEDRPDINLVFEMVLEGIYRGIGMDRTLFALLSPDRKILRAKYTVGWDSKQLSQLFHFRLNPEAAHIFDHVIQTQKTLWVGQPSHNTLDNLVTDEIREITGGRGFFVMPISLRGKVIGAIYADRRPSKRDLDADSFTAFKMFGQQARLGLNYLKGG